MKRIIVGVLSLLMLGVMLSARADEQPDVLVKAVVQDVLLALKQDKGGKPDQKKVLSVVDAKVLPLFDFTLMTKRAVGPTWKTASPEQKQKLIQEFRTLLVRAFINKAFADQSEHAVNFEPLKMSPGDDQVTVRTTISRKGEAALSVDYDMKKTANGWKVVDFAIAGSRLALDIYNAQFKEPLQQGGLDGLVQFLTEKNLAAANAPTRKADAK